MEAALIILGLSLAFVAGWCLALGRTVRGLEKVADLTLDCIEGHREVLEIHRDRLNALEHLE